MPMREENASRQVTRATLPTMVQSIATRKLLSACRRPVNKQVLTSTKTMPHTSVTWSTRRRARSGSLLLWPRYQGTISVPSPPAKMRPSTRLGTIMPTRKASVWPVAPNWRAMTTSRANPTNLLRNVTTAMSTAACATDCLCRRRVRDDWRDVLVFVFWSFSDNTLVPPLLNITLIVSVSYTHLRAHETRHDLVCRLLL